MGFKNKLLGKRITLIRLKPDLDLAKKMFAVVHKNRNHLDPWFPWSKNTKKTEDSMKYLFEVEERGKKSEKVDYGLFLENEYIGNISAFDISKKNKCCEIGSWISKDFTNKGYMTEAVKILEKYLFEDLGINRIQILCDVKNIPSASVAKKCGYILEGKIRDRKYDLFSKKFVSHYMFSKLKKEYKPKKSKK